MCRGVGISLLFLSLILSQCFCFFIFTFHFDPPLFLEDRRLAFFFSHMRAHDNEPSKASKEVQEERLGGSSRRIPGVGSGIRTRGRHLVSVAIWSFTSRLFFGSQFVDGPRHPGRYHTYRCLTAHSRCARIIIRKTRHTIPYCILDFFFFSCLLPMQTNRIHVCCR
ncbi:hypothetical protein GGR50DRAFT_274790 [Xylaria sp. CBS 124048]|nr:hypothetical protein GGR50DRAFT_274790 [Xylaria sp. CBS 124048]